MYQCRRRILVDRGMHLELRIKNCTCTYRRFQVGPLPEHSNLRLTNGLWASSESHVVLWCAHAYAVLYQVDVEAKSKSCDSLLAHWSVSNPNVTKVDNQPEQQRMRSRVQTCFPGYAILFDRFTQRPGYIGSHITHRPQSRDLRSSNAHTPTRYECMGIKSLSMYLTCVKDRRTLECVDAIWGNL